MFENNLYFMNKELTTINSRVLGISGENEQEKLIFTFDTFINGTAYLEVEFPNPKLNRVFIELTKVNQTYQLEVKNSLLVCEGYLKMQLRIAGETSVWKSKQFEMLVLEAVNAIDRIDDDYPNYILITNTRLTNLENNKVDKVTGKGLSTNDFSTAEKTKLAGIEAQANKTIVDVSLSETSTNPVQNKKVYEALAEKQEQIDALVEKNSTLKKQQLKGQASGSSIQLTDSAEDLEIENVVIKGTTSQNTYEGYNLLNPYLANQTLNGVTVTYNSESQEITLNGTCTADNVRFIFNSENIELPANTNLYGLIKYVSGSSEGYFGLRTYVENWTNNFIVESTTGINEDKSFSKNFDSDKTLSIFDIIVNSDSVFNNLKIKVMFSKENVGYEPYCGGEASPNLNYPQEIHCVTGTNNVNVQRKNIFPFPFTDAATTCSGVTVTVDSKNQTMSASGTTTSANFTWYFFSGNLEIKETYRLSSNLTASLLKIGYIKKGETAITWTTLASTSIFNDGDVIKQIYIQPSSTGTTIAYKDIYVQLEKGSTATEHTLYEEQNTPISLGAIKLYDGDKIQISFINKAGYKKVTGANVVKNMVKYTFTGNENYTKSSLSDENWFCGYISNNMISNIIMNSTIMKASRFSRIGQYTTITDSECIGCTRQFHVRVNTQDLVENSAEAWKNLLKTWYDAGEPLYVVYPLETPTTTPITDTTLLSQLEALINMETYKGITNIETTGSDLAPVLEFQYSKDLQTVIDSINARLELVEN